MARSYSELLERGNWETTRRSYKSQVFLGWKQSINKETAPTFVSQDSASVWFPDGRQSTRNTNQWLLDEVLVCIANGSLPITRRTSGDSDACPPTCYWVLGIVASRKSSTIGPASGHDTDHSFPRGRPHREVSFRRRRSLSLMISVISAAGRISIVPHFNFTPGDWEMS